MTEASLVAELKSGETSAFSQLVQQYQHMVYNTALGMLQSAEDAEDVAQEVFVQVFESIKGFKGESKLSTWLYRITVTRSLDRIKYLRRKKRGGPIASLFRSEETMNDVPDFHHPGVQLANKEMATILFKAMALLPDNQRIAFTLHKVEGMSQLEIAEVLECTVGAVEGYMHRARQNLRKLLENYYKQH